MIEANIQQTIIRNLLCNEEYLRKVIPFLKKEYFEAEHKILFNEIVSFVHKYNKLPTKESITVDMTTAGTLDQVSGLVDNVFIPETVNEEWLLNNAEKQGMRTREKFRIFGKNARSDLNSQRVNPLD